MKNAALIFLIAIVATACAPANPIVSDFNGHSVTIVTSAFTPVEEAKAAAQAEATRICRTGGKSRAEYASTRSNPQTYENSNLYLCL